MKKIVIIGGGVLGSQIAFQTAYCSFDVTILLRSEESIKRCKVKLDKLKETYIETINLMNSKDGKNPSNWARGIADYNSFNKKECLNLVEKAYSNIKLEINMEEVVKNADLIIECMPENVNEKKELYKSLAPLLSSKTIIATNSSTILPSKLAKYTGREDRFLALHFANSIWKNNTAEVMMHSKTDLKCFDKVVEFAKKIKMIPLPLKKEKSGYLLNSMLIPLLFSSLDLYANRISDPESIDKAWILGTGSPKGPFQILDIIGLVTAYNIVLMYTKTPTFLSPYNFKKIAKLLKEYIDAGKVGISSKEGFYKYDKNK